MRHASRRGLTRLSLFWKLLVPFLALMVIVGAFGLFVLVRDLSSRAQASVDRELARRSFDALAHVRDRELYLLESANFAANVEGMAAAAKAGDARAIERLLRSVLALKPEIGLVVLTDPRGVGSVELSRVEASGGISFGHDARWAEYAPVARVLARGDGMKASGFINLGGRRMFATAAPVCAARGGCALAGAAIVAIDAQALTAGSPGGSVAVYDVDGFRISTSGTTAPERAPREVPARHTGSVAGVETATLFAPFEVQGERSGTVAVSVPTGPEFSGVRGASTRLLLIVLLAMAGVVAVGALLSRSILGQVRPLVETHRALGRGDLAARAPVIGHDELAELAAGVNRMGEQLQASYETLEIRVEERTDEIRRLLRERTEFFAGMSHELRTPLAVILTQAEMLLVGSDDPTERSGASETIRASASELLELVNHILELARAEAGAMTVYVEQMRVDTLLRQLEPMFVRLGAAAEVDVEIYVAAPLLAVADRHRLREALVNLVDNAIKYTQPGGGVTVSAESDGDEHVRIAVSDAGVGIPEEVGDRVFEPFYRVPGTRPQRGQPSSGLGLALTRRSIEAQGGTVGWRRNTAGGTTFEVAIPAVSCGAGSGASSDTRSRRARVGDRRRRRRAPAC